MTERDRFSPVSEHLQNSHRVDEDLHQDTAWPLGRELGESLSLSSAPSSWLAPRAMGRAGAVP